ncbi:hypothetical protein HAX54_011378, partial [Datura stramonium]|nr:hypothetical protein [Datura stramonium]
MEELMNGENNEGGNHNSKADDGLINQQDMKDVELDEGKAAIHKGKCPMSKIHKLKMLTAEE